MYINHVPVMALTYFMAMSLHLNRENCKNAI